MLSNQNYLLQEQSSHIKNEFYQFIKQKNYQKVIDKMNQCKIKANEELSVKGSNWSALHYACHFDAPAIVYYFCKDIYKTNPFHFQKIMKLKTKDGWTPLAIACIYKSNDVFDILMKCGGQDLFEQDELKRDLMYISAHFGAIDCYEKLQNYLKQNPQGQVPMDIELLNGKKFDSDIFKLTAQFNYNNLDVQQMHLIEQGIRIGCFYCKKNTGYIKYTLCCGEPIHLICYEDQCQQKCPLCQSPYFEIQSTISHPLKAFKRRVN